MTERDFIHFINTFGEGELFHLKDNMGTNPIEHKLVLNKFGLNTKMFVFSREWSSKKSSE